MEKHPHIAILGLGLLGSSVARACKQFQSGCRIAAYDANPLTLEFAKTHGFIDTAAMDAKTAVTDADIVVIATPPSAAINLLGELKKAIPEKAMVTDVVSVKVPIAEAMRVHLPKGIQYVPAHPIAGSEQVGVAAGRADLFTGKRIILTPESPEDAGISEITAFWQQLGGIVEYMPAEIHDMVYAYVSHLPQLLAFALKDKVEQALESGAELPAHFQQFSRLCYSDRHLWDDIFLNNKPELDQALARFLVMFAHIRGELASEMQEHPSNGEISETRIWTELLPRLIASCLIGSVAQESKQAGFNFMRFAGNGFQDFTSPLRDAPDKHLEDISNFTVPIVAAMDEALASLAEWVVIKT